MKGVILLLIIDHFCSLSRPNFFPIELLLWKIKLSIAKMLSLNPNSTFSGKYSLSFRRIKPLPGMHKRNPMNPNPAISRSFVFPSTNYKSISCFCMQSSEGSGNPFQNYRWFATNHRLSEEHTPPLRKVIILTSGASTFPPKKIVEWVRIPGEIFLCQVNKLRILGFRTKLYIKDEEYKPGIS